MKNVLVVSIVAISFAFTACEKKPQGFGLENSPIRYQTKAFEDPEVLAEVNGQKYMKGQILDKSPVLTDLQTQENEAYVGLAYLRVVEKLGDLKPLGTVEMYLPETKAQLGDILARFGRTPTPGLAIAFRPAAGESKLVARYKDIQISKDELNSGHMVMQSLEQRRFQEIAAQLNGQLARILLGEKAAAEKRSLQDLLEKDVFKGQDIAVSDAELMAYLKTIGFAPEELTTELKPRFIEALKLRKSQRAMEEYVAKNILKGPIDVSFTAPQTKLSLNDNWTPIMGPKDAPISLVVFSGTNCPDCVPFIAALKETMAKYKGHLKLNWIHNFNEADGIARMMAEGALCVDSVKRGKSVDFLNTFAKVSDQVDEKAFYDWATKNDVNPEALKKCFMEKTNSPLIAQHLEYAHRIGIVANPTLWVEGRTVQGVISPDQLDRMVQDTIETKGSSSFAAFVRRIKGWFTGE
jgi:protein-disulfide isomerase